MHSLAAQLRVDCLDERLLEQAHQAAVRLGLSMHNQNADFALQLNEQGWQLQELTADSAGPLRVDFVGGSMGHRRRFGGGSGQMLARAVGIQGAIRPDILDATAGLGRDAFVLASLGCRVHMLERNPVVSWLLRDGLQRAAADGEVAPIVARMSLLEQDAITCMRNWHGDIPQVIYLDPMFPEREKSALVKKEMRLLQPLVGSDADAEQLLQAALELASHRVVVKRPRKAPFIAEHKPGHQLQGKSCRYDIYVRRSLRKT